MSLVLLSFSDCQHRISEITGNQCGDYPCCWTRDIIDKKLSENHILKGVELKTQKGVIAVHNPKNWWTKSKITQEKCSFTVTQNKNKEYVVTASFLKDPVVLTISMAGVDFYMGKVNENEMIVLQQHKLGSSLSYSNFNKKGILNYGGCADDGFFIKECANY